mmetsp:Transcript_8040/g.11215  ORF Transcript_8040/g.11215 Transcript_8040/m.11215 type:complete len:463 (+) Transcript_8040:78-1466(+)
MMAKTKEGTEQKLDATLLENGRVPEDIDISQRSEDPALFSGKSLRKMLKWRNPFETKKPKNGRGGTIFLILNTMIGSGILNQPQVFADSGIIGAFLMYGISCYAIWLGLQLLIEVGVAHKALGFTEVANLAFGRRGDLLVDWSIVVGNFGALLSYMVVISGELKVLLEGWTGESGKWYTSELFNLPLATLFLVLPFCLQRFYGHFVLISIFSIFAISTVLVVVLFFGPTVGADDRAASGAINWFSLSGTFSSLGSALFALSCAYAAFHAFEAMRRNTGAAWAGATTPAVVIGAGMCTSMGLAGYLSFRDYTEGDILDNFSGSGWDFMKILLIIHLLLYIPIDFVVMRHSVCKIFGWNVDTMHIAPYLVLTAILLAFTAGCVMALYAVGVAEGDAFGYILDFTGGLTAPILSFICPGAFYLKLMPRKDAPNWDLAFALLIFGFITIVLAPAATIYSIVEEYSS